MSVSDRSGGVDGRAIRGDGSGRTGVTVSVFTRGSMDARRRAESVVERLRDLERADQIGGVDVRTWPGEVSVRTGSLTGVVDTFERFEGWARDQGVSIRPPFAVRDRESAYTDESDTLLVTPVVCLAVFDADEIVGVYPCVDGDSVTTIDDFIEGLSRTDGALPRAAAVDPPGEDGRNGRSPGDG